MLPVGRSGLGRAHAASSPGHNLLQKQHVSQPSITRTRDTGLMTLFAKLLGYIKVWLTG